MRRRDACTFVVALIIASSVVSSVSAQVAGGVIAGTVSDTSGAALPNAKVIVHNVATSVDTELNSNESGFYRAANLLPGTYDVTASARGFSNLVRRSVVLTVGAELTIDLILRVGAAQDKIEVTAETPIVDTSTSTLSSVVNASTLRELPLNGRDWTSLATLQPGVTSVRTQSTVGATSSRGNRGFGDELTVAGHRPQENNYRIDGVSINDYSNGAPGGAGGANLGVDAISEFSVLTSNYSSEYGRTSGGVINAITRTGSNAFHGAGFGFFRDSSLDARNYFDAATKPPLRRYQFGGSAGGPIIKDKTFIFGNYEGLRLNQGVTFSDTVPSQAARNGQLSTGNVTVDPAVKPYLDFWALPNAGLLGAGDTGVYNVATDQTLKENFFTTRIDHHFSNTDSLFGTYMFDDASFDVPDSLNNEFFGNLTRRQLIAIEETHVFTQNFINTVRGGYNRTKGFVNTAGAAINPKAADLSLGTAPGRAAAIITVPGLTTFNGGVGANSFFDHIGNSYQFYDDAFITHGTHSFKVGFSFERSQYNLFALRRPNGLFAFGSLAKFLTNQPTSLFALDPARSKEAGLRQSIIGGYFHDNWRFTPSLTLNYGVRYEMSTNPIEAHDGLQTVVNLNGGAPVPVHTYFTNNPTLKNFEPRIGFAWDPQKNARTVVRGGFGVYDHLPLLYIYTPKAAQGTPFVVSTTVRNLPAGSFPKGAFSLANFSSLTGLGSTYIQPDPPRNYIMNWNLTIQRQLISDLTLQAAYVGSRGIHNAFTMDDSNIVLPVAKTAQGYVWPTPQGSGTRQDPNAGVLRSDWWDGDSYYHGLQTMVRKPLSHSFQIQGSYTWSKCLDTGSAASRGDQFLNGITSPLFFDKAHRKGFCDFNIFHTFTLSSLWNVPAPSGNALARAILGNWELGTILNSTSGTPFTAMISGDPLGLNSDDPIGYPNILSTPECKHPVNSGNAQHYIKTQCFTFPSPATLLGNSGRNGVVGPGLLDLDMSAYKNVPVSRISEAFRMQFRAEFFNILNHTNFAVPLSTNAIFNQSGNLLANAGRLTATQTTSRQIQLGVKVIW